QPRLPVLNDLGRATRSCGDDRFAERHRLDDYQAEGLRGRGVDDDVERVEPRDRVRLMTGEVDPGREAELAGERRELGWGRPLRARDRPADDREADGWQARSDFAGAVEEGRLPFPAIQAADDPDERHVRPPEDLADRPAAAAPGGYGRHRNPGVDAGYAHVGGQPPLLAHRVVAAADDDGGGNRRGLELPRRRPGDVVLPPDRWDRRGCGRDAGHPLPFPFARDDEACARAPDRLPQPIVGVSLRHHRNLAASLVEPAVERARLEEGSERLEAVRRQLSREGGERALGTAGL